MREGKGISRRDFLKGVVGSAATLTLLGIGGRAFGQQFKGVTIRVFTQTPPYIAKPVMMHGPEWEAATGGKIELITAPFADLYPKMFSSFALKAKAYDVVLYCSGWLGDFAVNNFLVPLDDFIAEDPRIDWEDILPVYRERIAAWGPTVYGIPLDGDSHMCYYRKDAIENTEYQKRFAEKYGYSLTPPQTWKQYRDIAEFFHGWDWDGDGEIEYGAVEFMRKGGQANWLYFSRAAAYASIPLQHGLFFDPDTMDALISSPGHVEALKDWIEILKFGYPGMIGFDSGEVRTIYHLGPVCLGIDWGDIGVLSDTGPESKVRGKVGYTILPGTTKTWDYKKGKWVEFAPENAAPYLAFGGWVGSIDVNSPNIEAAYDFLSYLSSPEVSYIDVTTPETGFNPYRKSHFAKLDRWYEFGFVYPADYLMAIEETIAHPNVQVDLRIPGTSKYMEAIEVQTSMALAGEKTPEEAMADAAKEWDRITDELGRDKQKRYFRESLGLPV
jgi:multiple sugar transport system substrate-binding protein